MKSKISMLLVFLLVFVSVISVANTGAYNGMHYNLNIIGVSHEKTAAMDNGSGHVIFVNLDGHSQINLTMGDEFKVLDANGTDRDGAEFQLPDPGLDPYIIGEETNEDTMADYTIFVRPLGKPGGYATITTCAELIESNLVNFLEKSDYRFLQTLNKEGYFGGIASIEQVGQDVTFRSKGKTYFADVTAELTTIVLEVVVEYETLEGIATKTIYVRVPIFDPMMEGYYWDYDNNGLKLLQVRIYPMGSDVTEKDVY